MSETRRIVAVVLPDLLCELANAAFTVPEKRPAVAERTPRSRPTAPLAVLLGSVAIENTAISDERVTEVSDPRAPIAAVNDTAKRFGVRVGQTVIEAQALLSHLVVRKVTREQVGERLGEIAEVALSFGPTVAVEAPDTVWVDVTGAVHLAGGEGALALDLVARVRALGHTAKVAISGGPRLAQAFARWGRVNREGSLVVPPEETVRSVATLPVQALPLNAERAAWLVRLGVFTVGELSRLPRAATASRLGDDASQVLDLAEGRDDAPLVAYVPQALPQEETTWDEPAFGVEPLLFVLRGLVSRLSARLEGRGEAVQALELVILHDRSTARFEGVPPITALYFELSSPLYRPEELSRVIASRLGRAELPAPAVGLRLQARAITRALSLQLSLSRYAMGLGGNAAKGPETLPVVLSELMTDLGKDKVGVLRLEGSHRPEKKSRLGKVVLNRKIQVESAGIAKTVSPSRAAPTRLLVPAVPFGAHLRPGATLSFEHRLYSVERVDFDYRLASVEWWTSEPISRDYARVWLQSANGGVEVIVYVDRNTHVRRIQAICD